MRPTRLELQGFASFREHTVVDFTDTDLFVLCGPTGAGKSTLIDAMTFALYGSVARYGTKLVEPVIAQGRRDARVLLEFTVEGVGYRAARVVQRTSAGGASTKEARLEKLPAQEGGDAVDLAMGAREVTAEVESLLGLSFEHFCRTVVLPQGAFQDFLHATPAERQSLLVELLDLGIYRDIAKRSRARADEAHAQITALSPRLEQLAGVSEEAIATVRARVATLETLAQLVDAAQPELAAIMERGAELRAAQNAAKSNLARLTAIEPPAGLDDLAGRVRQADDAVAVAAKHLEEATSRREHAEDASAGQPSATDLASLAKAIEARSDLDAAHAAAQAAEAAAHAEVAKTTAQAEATAAQATSAEEGLRQAELRQGVHGLREHLIAGEPCPLCEHPVGDIPAWDVPQDLDAARSALDQAKAKGQSSTKAATDAEVALARLTAQRASIEQRLQDHAAAVAATWADLCPDAGDVLDAAIAMGRADKAAESEVALSKLRTGERDARTAHKAQSEQRAQLDGARDAALQSLRAAQAGIADLGAPAASDDLSSSWSDLMQWAQVERPKRADALAAADAEVADAVAMWQERQQAVLDACTTAGVAVPGSSSAVGAVATARAEATAQVEALERQRAEAAHLKEMLDDWKDRANVATTLGRVLHANNFQQWLLARGLTRLVIGASAILSDLSNGAYTLALADDNAFLVADHRNAGEQRHARSLSGGETFLASLALALSLAEHVADLAAKGSARLESLFLDEGFGTLDADTLDVVATSIEELGATGRMVGLITHVPELASRLPVRFEVTKTANGSVVERVEA